MKNNGQKSISRQEETFEKEKQLYLRYSKEIFACNKLPTLDNFRYPSAELMEILRILRTRFDPIDKENKGQKNSKEIEVRK
jgi:hypothetical protein